VNKEPQRADPRLPNGILVVLVLMALACGGGPSSDAVVVDTDAAQMRVSLEPEAPRVGENRMWIELRDAKGEPVRSADVVASVKMPAMGAMPGMGGPSKATEVSPGRYRADFEIQMAGTWRVEVRATLSDGSVPVAEGSLKVGSPQLTLKSAGAAPGADAEARPEFTLSAERIQLIGVRSVAAEHVALSTPVRALGIVIFDESALQDVSLKIRGWVGELEVSAVGDPVEKGQVLFTLYSPELYAAQEEYLLALQSRERARKTLAPERADYLVRAAEKRLLLWDIAQSDLESLERRGTPLEHLPIRAARSGFAVEMNIAEGSGIEPGQRLYRIAPLDPVWIEAEVYESEIGLIEKGQSVSVDLPYEPGGIRYEGRVDYLYPSLSRQARTARIRIELENPDLALRPGMYATVRIEVDRGERLVVPQSAVLFAGDRSFVFRALGEGRFRPQKVRVGLTSGDLIEILEGLDAGDDVVASGTFLISSESRLRAALEQW